MKQLAKLPVHAQHVQRRQQARLKPHGPAGIGRRRDVGDGEMLALPAVGTALLWGGWGGHGGCFRWGGVCAVQALYAAYAAYAVSKAWPCPHTVRLNRVVCWTGCASVQAFKSSDSAKAEA